MPETKPKAGLATLVGRPLLAGAIAAGASAPATAVADIFLKLDGIEGESQDAKHKGEIDILSYTQSFRNETTSGTGGGGGAGKVTCGDVTVLKNIDKSSPPIIGAVATGKHIPKAVLTFRTLGAQQAEYYKVTLSDVLMVAIDQTDQPDPSKIVEKLQINASKFEFEYRPQKADGSLGAAVKFGFDCKANKKI
jgi:type VI secretion system secreted protein Hcp